MFRYIAIAWNGSMPQSSTIAQRLSSEWQRSGEWTADLNAPGLHVFTRGTRTGTNEARTLPSGKGIILGQLFRRKTSDSEATPAAILTQEEAALIADSDGCRLVESYWGRYVAFLQTATGATRVLRDPSGSLPCFCIRRHSVSIVFSWLEDAMQMIAASGPTAINWEVLTAQIMRGPLNGRHTALCDVAQILPGESLDMESGVSTLLWSAVDTARTPAICSLTEATELLGHEVRSCTRSWAACYETLLLRLSGGVDSSILLSCLNHAGTTADVICINYHSPGADTDERHFALMAARRAGRDLLMRERDPRFKIDRIMHMARMPSPVTYVGWMNASMDAAIASSYDASTMFTGAGGDPLFYEIPGWWTAADYLHDHGLGPGLPAAVLDAARLGRLSVWRTFKLALGEHLRPAARSKKPPGSFKLLNPELTDSYGTTNRFVHPALLCADDLPIGKYMQTAALMHPVHYYDPFQQEAAPELVYPLFSQPLVELCLRLPTYLLTRGGRGRAVARRAFAADLPPQIANRRSKGGIDDHAKAVLGANIDFVRGLLLEGELCRRGILQRSKVEEALSGRPSPLTWSLGQVHDLVAVEAWLARWQ